MSVDKKKVMAIAKSPEELCTTVAFPSIIQIHKDVIRRKDALAVCMRQHRKEGEVTCLLQIEFVNKDAEGGDDKKRKKKKLQHFTQIDEAMLRFLGMKIQVRFERHLAMKEARKKAQERLELVSMIRGFIKLKTYKAFLIAVKKDLTPFIGYKEITLLIYDKEKEKFFTQQYDERVQD